MSIERANILPVTHGALIVGSPPLVYDTAGAMVASFSTLARREPRSRADLAVGAVIGPDGVVAPVRAPDSVAGAMKEPRAALAPDGAVDVVWGSDDDDHDPWATAPARSIWTARFDRGHWSIPIQLLHDDGFLWGPNDVSPLVVGPDGVAHIVTTRAGAHGGGVLHLRRTADGWHSTVVQPPGTTTMLYPRIAVRGRELVIAFIAAGEQRTPQSAPSAARLFVTRSHDGGASWSRPVAVSSGDAEPALDPALLLGQGDTLFVVWHQATGMGRGGPFAPAAPGTGDSIHLAVSTDLGIRWNRHPPLAAPGRVDGVEAVIRSPGELFVAMRDRANELRPLVASWREGHWRLEPLPTVPQSFSPPSVAASPDGTVIVAWSRWFSYRRSVTVWARGRSECGAHR